jgi:hypothetical protein
MSWVRGLLRLGCRVIFVEEIDESVCIDAGGHRVSAELSVNRRWFDEVTCRFEMTGMSALCCRGDVVSGLSRPAVEEALRGADLLVNISGNLVDPEFRNRCRLQAYVDIDPGFTQLWTAGGSRAARLEDHDRYFTLGTNIGSALCPIPTQGIEWRALNPPVVLEDWMVDNTVTHESAEQSPTRFTTVATWRGPFGPIEWDRRRFGLKVHEFRKYIVLPELVDANFEAALAIHPSETTDLELLRGHGWNLVDPRRVAGTPDGFRRYIAQSTAEFSVAQQMYVLSSCGWFSDRTTRYLASGRPALVQDTGFSQHLPVGKGLVTFSSLEEARAGAVSILEDYPDHCAAARAVAEDHFDSDKVLARFLEECDVS